MLQYKIKIQKKKKKKRIFGVKYKKVTSLEKTKKSHPSGDKIDKQAGAHLMNPHAALTGPTHILLILGSLLSPL